MDATVEISNLKELAFTITRSVGQMVKAGSDSVILPERTKFLTDIKRDLESGQVSKIDTVVEKLSNIVGEMSEDFDKYTDILRTDVVKNLKELVSTKKDADKEVLQLQQRNISATTKLIEKDREVTYKAVILTNKELRKEKDEILKEEKSILADEKQLKKDIEKYQNEEERDDKKAKELADRQLALIKRQEDNEDKRNKLQLDKSKNFLEELSENIPEGLKDMFSSFKDTLMAPIEAFKGVGRVFVNLGKGIGQITKLFATLAKGLGRLLKSVLAAAAGFLASALPFLLIGAAIIAVGYGLFKLLDKLNLMTKEERDEQRKKDSSDYASDIQKGQQEKIEERNLKIDQDIADVNKELETLDKDYEEMGPFEKAFAPDKERKRERLQNKLERLQEFKYKNELKTKAITLVEERRAAGETVAGTIPEDIGQLQQMIETKGLMPHEMEDKGITPVAPGTTEYPPIIYQNTTNDNKQTNTTSLTTNPQVVNPETTANGMILGGV